MVGWKESFSLLILMETGGLVDIYALCNSRPFVIMECVLEIR